MVYDVRTIRLGPYMELRVDAGETIAYINGSAPHLFLRDGSDAYRLPQGQCVPSVANSARLVNPFPRHVECLIGRGLPVQFGSEAAELTAVQRSICYSQGVCIRDVAVDGSKFGAAFMMPSGRGKAVLWVNDGIDDGQTLAQIYSGVSADFLALRPAGFMDQSNIMLFEDGTRDLAALSIRGTYTDALAATWLAAAGVAGFTNAQRLLTRGNSRQQFIISENQAVVIARPVNAASNAAIFIRHLGLDLEDYE